ncbi:survival protein sure-like phosphatase/nucleotidase [Gongronella butleri]|nr:survival protein sure-like phosphatase/nucleotidase [Gongronella butleri]
MSEPKLRVLLSNDDGPPNEEESPFILPFIEHLEKRGWQVKVCLPDSQKSWISKSFMIKDHIKVSYYHRETHEVSYHQRDESDFVLLNGTPATCVNIAMYHLFKDMEFDLVITGPNFGRNSSTIYTLASGTIGSALEATICKKKAIALSFPFYSRNYSADQVENACQQATDVILQLWKRNNWPPYGLFNVNVPLTSERAMPVELTRFHHAGYGSLFKPLRNSNGDASMAGADDESQVRLASEGGNVHQQSFRFAPDIKAMSNPADAQPGTDAYCLQRKCISVTPMIAAYQLANMDEDYGVPKL